MEASPGAPWYQFGATKSDVIDKQLDFLLGCYNDRMHLLTKLTTLSDDPIELVKSGLCDPVKIHVKNEPHKRSKLLEERYRLICCISQLDELIDRVLFSVQDDAEISNYTTCPSQPGFGLSNDDAVSMLYKRVMAYHANWPGCSNDQSAWDWHVSWWLAKLDWAIRCELNGSRYDYEDPLNPNNSLWSRLAYIRYWCTFRSVFITSNGVMFKQTIPGIMKSGWKCTSSSNSRMRGEACIILGGCWCVTMGDDCNEQWRPGIVDDYKSIGFEMKDCVPIVNSEFEFCSHDFISPGIAVPKNWAKMFFRLLMAAPDQSKVEQFKLEMRHSPQLERCLGYLRRTWGSSTNIQI